MDAPLSQREFDTWREDDAVFKHVMRGYMNTQTALNLSTQGRISTLEAEQQECRDTLNRRTTWISALVAAIIAPIGALVSWLFSQR